MYQGRKKENIQTRATFFPLTKHLSSEYLKVAFFWDKTPIDFPRGDGENHGGNDGGEEVPGFLHGDFMTSNLEKWKRWMFHLETRWKYDS